MRMNDERAQELRLAIQLYNRGQYLESQEALEKIHNECGDEDRPLVRSLAMVACAMHLHFHRGGGRGALNLLRQSLILLDDLRPVRSGVQTAALYESLYAYVQDLQERADRKDRAGRVRRGATFLDRWLAPRIPLARE